jgi:hypothetical protein
MAPSLKRLALSWNIHSIISGASYIIIHKNNALAHHAITAALKSIHNLIDRLPGLSEHLTKLLF